MVKLIGGEGSQPWIDLAVLLEDTDDGIKVAQKIEMPQFAKGVTLEEGDLINSIQGESVLKIEKLMAETAPEE